MKEDKLSTHRKKAWAAFSLYIRTRDSIKTTGGLDQCVCITCHTEKPRTGVGCIQAGHFIPGRSNAVLFSELGVHGQCWQCNEYKHGAPDKYLEFMLRVYGQEVIDKLLEESHKTVKYKAWDYDEIAEKYKQKTNDIIVKFNERTL